MAERPTRAQRGTPRAGRRTTCRRAAIRRTLAEGRTEARPLVDAEGAPVPAVRSFAAVGSIAAAMVEAAEACECEACPRWLAEARRNLTFAGTLRREARSAERIGRGATEWTDRTLTERALVKAAEERSGARGVKRWHAKRRADSAANAAFDNLTTETTEEH